MNPTMLDISPVIYQWDDWARINQPSHAVLHYILQVISQGGDLYTNDLIVQTQGQNPKLSDTHCTLYAIKGYMVMVM